MKFKLMPGAQTGAAFAVIAALATGYGISSTLRGDDEQSIAESRESAVLQGLNAIPGFGYSSDAMLRDDLVASYETYLRDEIRAECMSEAGQPYAIRLEFPLESLVQIAAELDVPSAQKPGSSVSSAKWLLELAPAERDAYLLALYGVDSETYYGADDDSPSDGVGSEIILDKTRGCYGEAWQAVPGVWELRDALAEQVLALRHAARESEEMSAAEESFLTCARAFGVDARSPMAVEESGVRPEKQGEVLLECAPAYEESYGRVLVQLEAEFISTHPELQEQAERYNDFASLAEGDDGFREVLSRAIAEPA